LKRCILNDLILDKVDGIAGCSILELGAGNGYFLPLMLRRFSGQLARRIVITDQSRALLEIAQSEFLISGAEYQALDVQNAFPFDDATFDLTMAIMLFNELPTRYLEYALAECHRVLAQHGRLLAAIPHPALVHALARKGTLTDFGRGLFAMPGAEGMRLPVSRRSVEAYVAAIAAGGFRVSTEEVYANDEVLNAKPSIKVGRKVPLALLLDCRKSATLV
jgi:SAM-dependent methyltransferase